jgi:excisionase family DNA binding protein
MEEPLAYTPKGAAKATGQGRTTIFQDIKSGKLRAVKNGRRTLILRPDLEEYLSSMPTRAAGFLIVLGTVASLYSAAHHLPQREFVVKISDEYSRDSRLSDEVRVAERLVRKVADIRARAHGDYRALVARHVRRGPGSAPADFYPTPRDLTRGLIDGLAQTALAPEPWKVVKPQTRAGCALRCERFLALSEDPEFFVSITALDVEHYFWAPPEARQTAFESGASELRPLGQEQDRRSAATHEGIKL